MAGYESSGFPGGDGYPSYRRINQIQKFTDKEVQALKTFSTWIQTQVDTNWNAVPQWLRGSFRADLYLRLRAGSREIHYALPEGILPYSWLQSLRLAAERERVGGGNKPDKSTGNADGRRGLSGDARVSSSYSVSIAPEAIEEIVRRIGTKLSLKRREHSSRNKGSTRRKAKTVRKRSRLR